MASFLLREVLSATGGTVLGPTSELEFAGVSTDTRGNVEGRLFVALEGPHFDGHRFLAEAARKGARVSRAPLAASRGATPWAWPRSSGRSRPAPASSQRRC